MRISLVLIVLLLAGASGAAEETNTRIVLKTSMGDITLELFDSRAPISVRNFLGYVERGDYDGTIFYRVIPGFMVQGGDYDAEMVAREDAGPIPNEADNGLKNATGTVAMARTSEIDSASRAFFINVSDNSHLDHSDSSCTRKDKANVAAARERGLYKPLTCESFGYAVFGKVVDGMDVVHDIEFAETEARKGFENLPVEPIAIESVAIISQPPSR